VDVVTETAGALATLPQLLTLNNNLLPFLMFLVLSKYFKGI
jgi:hypothetical protein